jgi:hypothetical protein
MVGDLLGQVIVIREGMNPVPPQCRHIPFQQ